MDHELHYRLIVIYYHVLSNTPTDAKTVLKTTIKGKSVGGDTGDQFQEISTASPK